MEPYKLSGPDWSIDSADSNDLLKQIEEYVLISNSNTSALPNTGIGHWGISPINNYTTINGPVTSNEIMVPVGSSK